MSNADPIRPAQIPVQAVHHRPVPAEEEATLPPPPLSAERFGLAVGRIMERFGIMALPVPTATGTVVGTLMLSTGTFGRITKTCVAWGRIEESEIQQDIHDIAGRDLPLDSGVYAVWDSAGGVERLDAHRNEITAALIGAVAAQRG